MIKNLTAVMAVFFFGAACGSGLPLVPKSQSFSKADMVRDPYYYSPKNPDQTGILDPSRFSMHHTYSLQYSSGSRESNMLGAYINTMTYNFNLPMQLTLDIGYFHQPQALLRSGKQLSGQGNGSFVAPRVQLDYQPSKNVLMSLQYLYVPCSNYSGNNLLSTFRRTPYPF